MKLLRVQRNISGRSIFVKKTKSTFFDFWTLSKSFSEFCRNISAGSSKLFFTSTEEHFDDWFSWKNFFSSCSHFFCKNFSRFWRKFPVNFVKSAIWVSSGTFWGKSNFLIFLEKTSDFWEEDFAWIVEIAFHVSMGMFWGTFFRRKRNKVFFGFQILSENISDFRRIDFGKFARSGIRVSKVTFWKKQSVWNKIYVLLGRFWSSRQLPLELWQKKLSKVVQTAFYGSRRRLWAKTSFLG